MINEERKMVIKDSIFEALMMGGNLKATIANLHLEFGFSKDEIVEALKEMKEEAGED